MRERGLWIALAVAAAVWLATLAAYRAPPAAPIDAPPAQFSGTRARQLLRTLLDDGAPHPMGSLANAQLRARIVSQLRELGYEPELQGGIMVCSRFGVCGMPTNILARLDGDEPPGGGGSAILLAAHYDSVAAGPGASDDGAGVASVLEIARILKQRSRPRHTVILLLDDGEEPGLLGAEAFVQRHRWAGSVAAAVNLEARGTSGPSLMFETGTANRWLIGLYAQAVARPLANSAYYAAYRRMPNDTDFSVFKAAGYQGFNFAFIGDVAGYHTPLDDWRHADAGSIDMQGAQALASLGALANARLERASSGEAVYFDLYGRTLVRIPRAWLVPGALACLMGLLMLCVWLIRRGQLSARALLWGAVGQLAALAVGAAAAAALLALLHELGALELGGAYVSVAHPWPLQLCFVGLAFWVSARMASLLRSRAGFPGLMLAGALLYAVFALALALGLPAASYLALTVAGAALLTLTLALAAGRRAAGGAEWAASAVSAVSFTVVMPLVVPLYGALGSSALPLTSVLLIYAGFSLAALMAPAAPRTQSRLCAGAAAGMLLGMAAALLLPRHTPQAPERVNLLYDLDGDGLRAQWLVDSASDRIPPQWSSAAAFASHARPAPAALERRVFAATAPSLALPLPQLSVRSASVVTGGAGTAPRAHYRLHVSSARAAPILELLFAPTAAVDSVQLGSGGAPSVRVRPRRLAGGESLLRLWSLPADGIDVDFEATNAAFDLQLMDRSFGLPPPGQALQRARGAAAVPSHEGDVTVVRRSYRLRPPSSR